MFNIRLHWLGVGLWFLAQVFLLIMEGVGQQLKWAGSHLCPHCPFEMLYRILVLLVCEEDTRYKMGVVVGYLPDTELE